MLQRPLAPGQAKLSGADGAFVRIILQIGAADGVVALFLWQAASQELAFTLILGFMRANKRSPKQRIDDAGAALALVAAAQAPCFSAQRTLVLTLMPFYSLSAPNRAAAQIHKAAFVLVRHGVIGDPELLGNLDFYAARCKLEKGDCCCTLP